MQGAVRADGTQAAQLKAWRQQRAAEGALSAAEAAVKAGLHVGFSLLWPQWCPLAMAYHHAS